MKDLKGLGGSGRGRWCAEGDAGFPVEVDVDVEVEDDGPEDGPKDGDEAEEESFEETADSPAAAEVATEEALDAAFDADSATIAFIVDVDADADPPVDNEDIEANDEDATVPAVDNGAAGGRYRSNSLSSLVKRD
jgi:hypothetical protein